MQGAVQLLLHNLQSLLHKCVRVCGRGSEMLGEAWSSVCEVVLWHHPPSKVSPVMGDSWGMGWVQRGGNGGSLRWCQGHWLGDQLGATHYWSLANHWTLWGSVCIDTYTWSLQLTQPHCSICLSVCRWYCQSTTSCTELHTPPSISEALSCTLMHCIVDSADCTTTILPLASVPPHMLLLVCLFVCLCLLLTGSRLMLSLTAPIV